MVSVCDVRFPNFLRVDAPDRSARPVRRLCAGGAARQHSPAVPLSVQSARQLLPRTARVELHLLDPGAKW